MKSRYIAVAVAAILAIGVGVVAAQAHSNEGGFGHDHMFGRHMGWIARQLDLTDAQKAQIKSTIQAEKPTLTPLLQQLVTQRQQMLAATANGAFDQAKVQALANQQAQTMAQLIVERQKIISSVYQNVLTPEQRTKADALRQKMSEHMTQRLQKFNSEGGAAPQQ
jgi:protein CpxP